MEFRDLKKQYEVLGPEIDRAIQEVLDAGSFIGGEPVRMLEQELAEYAGVRHCITCANGTDALTLALKVWGIGASDAVFVPDFTFFSTAECPAAEGAHVVFVDVDPDTYNMDPVQLRLAIERILEEGRFCPRVVIAVDLFGQPADYPAIREICVQYDLHLLEDGAQGFGGRIGEKRACSFGDISTTSFFPAKPLGCYGDGGAIFTDNAEWAERIRSLAVHGKGADKYDNVRFGMNSRLDTLQAAILRVKLRAFRDTELMRVNQVAAWYEEVLCDSLVKGPIVKEGFYSSFAQYTVQLPKGTDREEVQRTLAEQGVPTNIYYKKPLHLQEAFRAQQEEYFDKELCPVTTDLCERVLSLPMYPYLEKGEVERVMKGINLWERK